MDGDERFGKKRVLNLFLGFSFGDPCNRCKIVGLENVNAPLHLVTFIGVNKVTVAVR